MGEAREVMDRMTGAAMAGDRATLAACYAEDAVAVTPDAGEITGREAITNYFLQFNGAFSDFSYEYVQKHESLHAAIDEGHLIGMNTGPLPLPSGETIPATGRQIRVRSCDVATVENGQIIVHHIYFDQMELLGQLGLLPSGATT